MGRGRRRSERRADLEASTTDPDATAMDTAGGVRLGYKTHYVVDGGKARVIVAVLVTPAEVRDNQPAADLLWHARFRWGLRLRQVTGDKHYATFELIAALEDAGVRAYVPLPDWDRRPPYYGPSRFAFDPERDEYRCPQGHALRRHHVSNRVEAWIYRADKAVCAACPVRAACTDSRLGRSLSRSFWAEYVDRVRAYQQTPAYQKALRKRSVWVEPLFGEAKDWHGLRRFRLRRLPKVNTQALLTATGQNLKRLLRRRGWGRRPWPGHPTTAAVPKRPCPVEPRSVPRSLHEAYVCPALRHGSGRSPGGRPPRSGLFNTLPRKRNRCAGRAKGGGVAWRRPPRRAARPAPTPPAPVAPARGRSRQARTVSVHQKVLDLGPAPGVPVDRLRPPLGESLRSRPGC